MDTEGELAAICDLRQQLAALEQREERFRLAVESSRDGMWDWNVVTGEVYYSPRWLEVLGYRDSDIAPNVSTWERLLHPDDMAHVMAALQRHLANESAWYEAEFRLRTGSGTWLWAHDRGKVVMRDVQGAPLRVIGSFTDITERKQAELIAEQQRAELQQQIIEAQRAAIRELSSPLLPITDHILVMPLVGTIDSTRAQLVLETLLKGVMVHQATLVIMDITGVQVVDTQVANSFIHAAQAVQLLGAQVMITGIQPAMAQTLAQLGVNLGDIVTRGTLQAGIAYALQESTEFSLGKPGIR